MQKVFTIHKMIFSLKETNIYSGIDSKTFLKDTQITGSTFEFEKTKLNWRTRYLDLLRMKNK